MCACVFEFVYVCAWFSNWVVIYYNRKAITYLYSWRFLQEWMLDLRFTGIWNFWKNFCDSFRKIRVVLKLYTFIIHRSKTIDIEFIQNRSVFKFFEMLKFLKIFCKCFNSKLKFGILELANTRRCVVFNLVWIVEDL